MRAILAAAVLLTLATPAQAAPCGEGPGYGAEKPPTWTEHRAERFDLELEGEDALTPAAVAEAKAELRDLREGWTGWVEDYDHHVAVCEAAEATTYSVASSGGNLASIRACESHGEYNAVSPSGAYRGAYQFDYETWQSVGGSGDPAAASPEEQDYRASLLMQERGTAPWPVCG